MIEDYLGSESSPLSRVKTLRIQMGCVLLGKTEPCEQIHMAILVKSSNLFAIIIQYSCSFTHRKDRRLLTYPSSYTGMKPGERERSDCFPFFNGTVGSNHKPIHEQSLSIYGRPSWAQD